MYRIGQSTDQHRFAKGRPFILGGVDIPCEKGLIGHSDADVLAHVVAEALLGALGMGDLGTLFPDTDPTYRDQASLFFVQEANHLCQTAGYKVVNIDTILIVETPMLAPFKDAMRQNLAQALMISPQAMNIKATRGEGLGFIGRDEGIVAQAVVLLKKNTA